MSGAVLLLLLGCAFMLGLVLGWHWGFRDGRRIYENDRDWWKARTQYWEGRAIGAERKVERATRKPKPTTPRPVRRKGAR